MHGLVPHGGGAGLPAPGKVVAGCAGERSWLRGSFAVVLCWFSVSWAGKVPVTGSGVQ